MALKRIGDFDSPTYVTGAPGFPHLLFVVQRDGRIALMRHGRRLPRPFLDISARVNGGALERGLLGLAFPPDYRRSRHLYVQYTNSAGDVQIDEYRRARPEFAPASSRRPLITVAQPPGYPNHNGGQLQFRGRFLYSGIGDGADPGDVFNHAQDLGSLRGKILRVNPRPSPGGRPYRVPRSNPFVGRPGRDEIFSYGLRNPFRFSFERRPRSGDRILIADVGQNRFEELDYLPLSAARGANFGWDAFEGSEPYACGALCPNAGTPDPGRTVAPVFTQPHADGNCAIIGGYVIHDPALPRLRGRYLHGDYCSGRIGALGLRRGAAGNDRNLAAVKLRPGRLGFAALTSFGLGPGRRLYVASENGPVYRLVPSP